ncbi:hypothetical protein [Saccharothrix sp. Mg75]|uniref:hypothetical protein n=1 Tax=Saccharothrix sp. Mg75 TaxID=3445357 RepID=UPI003EE85EEE
MGKRSRRATAVVTAVIAALVVATPTWGAPDDPIADPIPRDPVPSRFGLVLAEVARLQRLNERWRMS